MKFIASLIFCSALSIFGQSSNTNNITGQWDFDQGDLRATIGSPLVFRGDSAASASFEERVIDGGRARVLRLPEFNPDQGLIMPHGAKANGGGANVNHYTLIMDVLWPTESDQQWRAVLQSDTNNVDDAIIFVNPANGIGINNTYQGSLAPNVWHRIALVFDLTASETNLTKYIVGVTNFSQNLGTSTLDSRFSLAPTALLFTGAPGDSAPVLINSIQFRSEAMNAEAIAELGKPTAGGISGGSGLPLEDVKIEHIQKVGTEIVLTVSGGGNLQLQKALSLVNPTWQNAGDPSSSGTFRVPATDQKAFFRVLRL